MFAHNEYRWGTIDFESTIDNNNLLCMRSIETKKYVELRKVRERSRIFELNVMLFKDKVANSYFSKSESMQMILTLTTKLKLEEETIDNEAGSLENAIDCINDLNTTYQPDNEGIGDDVDMGWEDEDLIKIVITISIIIQIQ